MIKKFRLDFGTILDQEITDETLPTYELISVSNHCGSIYAGHCKLTSFYFTAFNHAIKLYFHQFEDYTFALNEYDNKWYEFDDRNVKEMEKENLCVIYFLTFYFQPYRA